MSLSKKIVEVLESNPKMSYNSVGIYDMVFSKKFPRNKKNLAMIRTELNRLHNRGVIRKEDRGFFQAKPSSKIITLLENPETKLHGIKMEFSIESEHNIFGMDGITSQFNIFFEANHFRKTTNNRFTNSVWWESREIIITFHRSGFVEVFISCSKNPLGYSDFIRCYEFLKGFFNPVAVFDSRFVRLRQVGLCRDFKELRLEGLSSVSLHTFLNDWSRVYQKDSLVRFERHLTLNITLKEAFDSLRTINEYPPKNGFSKDVLGCDPSYV